jgi:acyl carrier protein
MKPHMTTESEIISIVKKVLKHKGLPDADVELSSALYDGGLGLDSLSAAELSVALENTFGKDPYTSGQLPQTVGEIANYYAAAE